VNDEKWRLTFLTRVCDLVDIRSHFRDSLSDWRAYYDDVAPHEAELPQTWKERLNDFQTILVLRCIRPDKVRLRF